VGDVVAGARVSDYMGHQHTGEGNQHVYRVICHCGAEFKTNQKVMVNKWRDLEKLQCIKCVNIVRGLRNRKV
jgi:hypothetical protein